jgi:hypothetical protein
MWERTGMVHHLISNMRLGREPQGQVWIDLEGHGERKLNYSFPGTRGRERGEEEILPLCVDILTLTV